MSLIKIHDELYIPDNFAEDHSYYADAEGTKAYTGITTVLGVIAKNALIQWSANEAVKYVKEAKIWQLVPDTPRMIMIGDKELDTLLEDARYAHRKKKEAAGETGTDLHALAEGWIKMCIQEFDGRSLSVCPAGLEKFRDWAQDENIRFVASEKKLYSKTWFIAGTADFIFTKEDRFFIGDLKTQKKLWGREPMLQCAGYASMFEEMKEGEISGYCVVRISKDGSFEVKWSYDTIGDTKAFFAAVELYRCLKNWVV